MYHFSKYLIVSIFVFIQTFTGTPQNSSTVLEDRTDQSYASDLPTISSIRFAVLGDYGYAGPAEEDVANLIKSWNPDIITTVGDNNYPSGEASTIDANIGQYYHDYIYPYLGSYGTGSVTNNFFPALGNHDWYTPNAQPYLDYFTLPGNERYYDFVRGPVHFFVINSDINEPDGIDSASTQALWLQSRLASSTSSWNIVLLHHAPYSSGMHGSNTTLQWPYQAWGADAVISGHDHVYERLIIGGFPYFVNGLGGQSIANFNTTSTIGSQIRYNNDFGAMRVDASDDYINFKFISRTGQEIDSYSLGMPPTSLVNSTLPTSRTTLSGTKVTIFSTVLNAGSVPASGVVLSMDPQPPGLFTYRQTDCETNAVVSEQNPILDLPVNGKLCYVLSFTPSEPFDPTYVHIKPQANNAPGTDMLLGINTWLLRATASVGPDIIALTTTTDFHQIACFGQNAFAVALSNVGAAAIGNITVTANTGSAVLPLNVTVSESDPGTGQIIGDNILENVEAGENRTVVVFVTFNGCVSFNPATNRIFIEFRDASNNVVGSTSTAVSTNR